MANALAAAAEATDPDETYGDVNHTGAVTHPFDRDFLNYPEHPTAGSPQTVNNFRAESAVGSSEEHAAAGGRVEYTGDGPVVTGLDRPPTAGGRDAGRGNEVSGRRLRGLGEPCLVGPCRRAVGAVRERRREAGE